MDHHTAKAGGWLLRSLAHKQAGCVFRQQPASTDTHGALHTPGMCGSAGPMRWFAACVCLCPYVQLLPSLPGIAVLCSVKLDKITEEGRGINSACETQAAPPPPAQQPQTKMTLGKNLYSAAGEVLRHLFCGISPRLYQNNTFGWYAPGQCACAVLTHLIVHLGVDKDHTPPGVHPKVLVALAPPVARPFPASGEQVPRP